MDIFNKYLNESVMVEKCQDAYNDPEFPEMFAWFEKRTYEHIEKVQKYISIAIDEIDGLDYKEMMLRYRYHDSDKFEQPLLVPYVYMTWMYHCIYGLKKEYKLSDVMQKSCNDMSFKHCKQNKHHPEYWDCSLEKNPDLIGTDRDKVEGICTTPVDATKMDKESMTEMVCDWCSVSEERGNSPKEWFNKNNNKRWVFDKYQQKFIKEVIKKIWKRR